MVNNEEMEVEFYANRQQLFVGNLHKDVTNQDLYEVFSLISPNVICLVQCNPAGGSRGFAYVKYVNYNDAERAKETLNYFEMKGQCISISWKAQDLKSISKPEANVFVKNIPIYMNERDLHKIAQPFGETISIKIVRYPCGVSKGYGYVQFFSEESAKAFIEHVCKVKIQGVYLHAEPFKAKRPPISNLERIASDSTDVESGQTDDNEALQMIVADYEAPTNRLFISNIDQNISATKMENILSAFGEVKSFQFDSAAGQATVVFSSVHVAAKALTLDNTYLGDKKLSITREM